MTTEIFVVNEILALLVLPLALLASFLLPGESKVKALLLSQLCAFALALIGGILRLAVPQLPVLAGAEFFSFHFNAMSSCLLAAVLFIASVVLVFSERYLSGETNRLNFLRGIMLLSSAASLLTVTDSIVTAIVCWHVLSLGLWSLMRMQPLSSRQAEGVILFHLSSDLLMLLASVLVIVYGSCTRFSELSADAHLSGVQNGIVSSLLVLAFGIKSALFPFHKWLLNTLNAPTPLSGLLHAGVVNVSAVMALNFSPILSGQTMVMLAWASWAAISAMLGTLSMSAQPDVKRKLVYSTVGQMGFMLLQCASGAYAAAIFHLIAHGMFKCHMFLQSGSAVADGIAKRKFAYVGDSNLANLLCVTLLSTACCVGMLFLRDFNWTVISALITAAAVSCAIPTLGRVRFATLSAFWLLCIGVVSLAELFSLKLESLSVVTQGDNSLFLALALLVFALGSVFLAFIRESRLSKWIYVQGLNGFYADEMGAAVLRSINGK